MEITNDQIQEEQKKKKLDENQVAQIKLIICRVLAYLFMGILAFICLVFFWLLFINSTKTNNAIKGHFSFIPALPGTKDYHWLANLKNALGIDADIKTQIGGFKYGRGLLNSTIVALGCSILTTYFSALTAYAIHAYNFKMKRAAEIFILAIMMIPSQVSSVGFIKMCYDLGLTNKLFMLVIPAIAAPSTFFYMIQYLRSTLPLELIEASRIDGTSEFGTFNRIVLPIMKPAIAVQFIFSFVGTWNNYYIPSLLLTDEKKKTLPIMIALIRSSNPERIDMGMIYMAIALTIIPVIVVYIALSKFIIKGVTSGSVKG